jgi:hypothetical protein
VNVCCIGGGLQLTKVTRMQTACQMIGRKVVTHIKHIYLLIPPTVKSLKDAHPGLLNTGEIDHLVYRGDSHPYARKIVRQAKL